MIPQKQRYHASKIKGKPSKTEVNATLIKAFTFVCIEKTTIKQPVTMI
jgi:hypothetical protein